MRKIYTICHARKSERHLISYFQFQDEVISNEILWNGHQSIFFMCKGVPIFICVDRKCTSVASRNNNLFIYIELLDEILAELPDENVDPNSFLTC